MKDVTSEGVSAAGHAGISWLSKFALGLKSHRTENSLLLLGDCFDWLSRVSENSIHAIVTDPPYGVKEFDEREIQKRTAGKGGVWRIPPSFDGSIRSPLPRFTAHSEQELRRLVNFFEDWSKLALRALRPGGHVFIATSSIVAPLIYESMRKGGLDFRGQIIRTVRTLRGGDRPKNAHEEFPGVCVLPKGCYEPWGLFRKPLLPGMKVADCLRDFQTGGLRRLANGNPFEDLIYNERTPVREKQLARHPSLKPQSFMRLLVYAALPLGTGVVVDTFMGAGSTIAAAEAVQVQAVGIERSPEYFEIASKAVPRLKALEVPGIDELTGGGQRNLFGKSSSLLPCIQKQNKRKYPSSASAATRHHKSN